MRRRELLGLLGSTPLWPLAARGQQSMPVIGLLHSASLTRTRQELSAFWEGLQQAGLEQRNIAVDYRWAEGRDELLPSLAADLVRKGVAVIVAGGTGNSVMAAKRATQNIPIVFVSSADPVRSGIVASLGHPGSNVTGVSFDFTEQLARQLEVLHELALQLVSVVALVNPEHSNMAVQLQYLSDTAKRIGVQVQILNASGEAAFKAALDEIAQRRADAMLVANDGFLNSKRDALVALTTSYAIPTIFGNREFVEAGGLMSYGPSLVEAYRRAGIYVGRILKGENPADLPVQHPIELELVINLKTAESFGLKIPPGLLAVAERVLE